MMVRPPFPTPTPLAVFLPAVLALLSFLFAGWAKLATVETRQNDDRDRLLRIEQKIDQLLSR